MTSTLQTETHLTFPAFSIGLTGGIGCGKTTVANLFAALGATIIDTDVIAHSLTTPDGAAIDAITKAFGPAFITADGAMDRPMMRRHVFQHPAARQQLEQILHPLIHHETLRAATHMTGTYPIFVVPLLLESPRWQGKTSRITVVDCAEEVQIARVMARSQLSREEVLAIMAAQTSRAARLQKADDIIHNDGQPEALRPQIEQLHAFYCDLAQTNHTARL